MGVAVAIGVHSLHVDDATAGDTAAGCVSGAARRMKPRRRGRALGGRGARPRAFAHRPHIRTRAQQRGPMPRAAASLLGRHDQRAGWPALIVVGGPEEDRVGARAGGEDLEAGGGVLVRVRDQPQVRHLDAARLVDRDLERRGSALLQASSVGRVRIERDRARPGCLPGLALRSPEPPPGQCPRPGPSPRSARLRFGSREAAKTTPRGRPCPKRWRTAVVRV